MISRVATGTRAWRSLAVAVTAFLAVTLIALPATTPIAADQAKSEHDGRDGDEHRDESASWSMSGQGITNWRFQPDETKLNAHNVRSLRPTWVATLAGDISATPAVVDGAVYVPDWGGNVSKLDASTGAVIWSKSVGALIGVPGSKSRTSPAVVGDAVILGSQAGAYLFALDRRTGNLKWKTQLDAHPTAVVTQSPTVHKGTVYVGVASLEEVVAGNIIDYPCCTFRGSALAVRVADGHIKWKTYTTLDNRGLPGGYAGASVWGSSPAIDVKRGRVYVTTGNNFDAPQSVKSCVAQNGAGDVCEPQSNGNYVDAVLALDMDGGNIVWARKLEGYDAWTVGCIPPPFSVPGSFCPTPPGPDYDFGQGPLLIHTRHGDIVAAGQKSGVMWGLRADNGTVAWSTVAGPGSSLGGMEWGSATDGERIYYAIANLNFVAYGLTNPPPGTPSTSIAGSWGAIDPATGAILWQTADPNTAMDTGPVSVANGVVYVGSMAGFPGSTLGKATMFALDARTGEQLWSFVSGGSVNAGPAIVDGQLFWGSGFANYGLGDSNSKLFSFSR
jgi:polyvinyl alcohol dehydrogenase (cytochrome)